jgi:hypothetical protein
MRKLASLGCVTCIMCAMVLGVELLAIFAVMLIAGVQIYIHERD